MLARMHIIGIVGLAIAVVPTISDSAQEGKKAVAHIYSHPHGSFIGSLDFKMIDVDLIKITVGWHFMFNSKYPLVTIGLNRNGNADPNDPSLIIIHDDFDYNIIEEQGRYMHVLGCLGCGTADDIINSRVILFSNNAKDTSYTVIGSGLVLEPSDSEESYSENSYSENSYSTNSSSANSSSTNSSSEISSSANSSSTNLSSEISSSANSSSTNSSSKISSSANSSSTNSSSKISSSANSSSTNSSSKISSSTNSSSISPSEQPVAGGFESYVSLVDKLSLSFDAIADLYDAADYKFAGAMFFNRTRPHGVSAVILTGNAKLQQQGLRAEVYPVENVHFHCRTTGYGLLRRYRDKPAEMVKFSLNSNNSTFGKVNGFTYNASPSMLQPSSELYIGGRVIVISTDGPTLQSKNSNEIEYLACGLIRDEAYGKDDFLQWIPESKPKLVSHLTRTAELLKNQVCQM